MPTKLWMRHETRPAEHRAPLAPGDAARLIEQGVQLTVEESPGRVFPLTDYLAVGATAAPAGGWASADPDWHILGLKELPDTGEPLVHRHIFFGHAYGGQLGADALLRRFAAGDGALLDLEFLVDDEGRRLVAFGYWAGYVGAALAVLQQRGQLPVPLQPTTRRHLDQALRAGPLQPDVRALVIGALGRCGRGAQEALAVAGVATTAWDVAETRCLDRPALLGHQLLVNAVKTERPLTSFVTASDLDAPGRRLSVISDVTCDVTSNRHLLPVYKDVTDWQQPARRVAAGPPPVDVIAIDNLPSLLPAEASTSFSAQLTPLLARLGQEGSPWDGALPMFQANLEGTRV
jgi:saccharopine dehydrogenase (NAD+, L-lysine-forming)